MSEYKENNLPSCWVLTEGIAGTENQCLGVAEALALSPVIKRVKLRTPWKQLSPWLRCGHRYALAPESDSIVPPWPDLLIASGRKSIGIALDIKKRSGGKTFLVQIQDPRIHPASFDLIAVPQHDPMRGENVIVTTGALNRITPEKLQLAREKWEETLAALPAPRVAVLLGGNSKAHRMTAAGCRNLVAQLRKLKAGLMITASRRTGEENMRFLREIPQGDNIFFWNGAGDNPYFGFLAHADYIIVTEDSVSMTSEAIATGKPVYIAKLEGGAARLNLFHRLLQEQGYTRPFTGLLEPWSYEPPDDTAKIAAEIRRRMKERKKNDANA